MLVDEFTEEQKSKLLRILKNITEYTLLNSIGLVTTTGDCLAFFSNQSDVMDIFSAISASVSHTSTAVGNQLGHGEVQSVFIRGETGFTVFCINKPYILIGSSENDQKSTIGLVDRIFRRYIDEIPKIFEHSPDIDTDLDTEQTISSLLRSSL